MRIRRPAVIVGWLVFAGLAAWFVLPSIKCDGGHAIVRTPDGRMALVPGGPAAIGGDYTGDPDEVIGYSQDLKPFWMDVKEVAAAEFELYLRETPGARLGANAPAGASSADGAAGTSTAGTAAAAGTATAGGAAPGAAAPVPADGGDLPAVGVTWRQAVGYCNWLSRRQGLRPVYAIRGDAVAADWGADGYRLPTEAEYEYAMKGGPYATGTRYPGSNFWEEVAHCGQNTAKLAPRGTLKPNQLGLYDLAGNAAEWVWDRYGMFAGGVRQDYRGPDKGDFRCLRGGSWTDDYNDMRVGDRNYQDPAQSEPDVGFRTARNATGEYAAVVVLPAAPKPLPAVPADAPYKDAKRTVAERVDDLLSRMSLEEKIGQMTQVAWDYLGSPEPVADKLLGSVLSGGDATPGQGTAAEWRALADGYRKAALGTRLGIPILFGVDEVHGAGKVRGATYFPHNIGLGAADDAPAVEEMGRAVAAEMRAAGQDWDFAPCLAVGRDERWGRTYESFGEDPGLAGRLGAAFVRGLQAPAPGGAPVAATAKHYLADGGTAGGVDRGDARIDEAELRRLHLAPYAAAVKAGAASVMVSYSSWNGVPMHANRRLIQDVLRGELGFKGLIVSDWGAWKLLPGKPLDQAAAMVNAGVDMCMAPDYGGAADFPQLARAAVAAGLIPQARIDEATRRILALKFAMGLFEHPYGLERKDAAIGAAAHRRLARRLAAESLVVLKNEGVLPIKARTIWLGGALAFDARAQCGGWTMGWQGADQALAGVTTIGEAVRQRAARAGAAVREFAGPALPDGPLPDLAVVVAGEQPYAEFGGDKQDLRLPAADRELIAALKAKGCRVLLVLVSGRPMALADELPRLDGLAAAWLPGSEGGGVADVLFGDSRPRGKSPVSWPLDNAGVPVNAGDGRPARFPFGYGLGW